MTTATYRSTAHAQLTFVRQVDINSRLELLPQGRQVASCRCLMKRRTHCTSMRYSEDDMKWKLSCADEAGNRGRRTLLDLRIGSSFIARLLPLLPRAPRLCWRRHEGERHHQRPHQESWGTRGRPVHIPLQRAHASQPQSTTLHGEATLPRSHVACYRVAQWALSGAATLRRSLTS